MNKKSKTKNYNKNLKESIKQQIKIKTLHDNQIKKDQY
jgi:hypothetical protein